MSAGDETMSGGIKLEAVFEMVRGGDVQQVMVRVQQDKRLLSKVDENGRTLLHWAASGGHKELVQWLLEHQAEKDPRDDVRWTPLIIASSAGHEAVVRLLLGVGADVNACTDQGRSSLLYAASRNRKPIVKILMDEGANVNLQDKLGATPLHRAVGCGHVEVVKQLMTANQLDLEAQDDYLNTPLHLACEESQVEIIRLLLQAGVDTEKANKEKKTPFQLAKPAIQQIIRNLI